jgi:AbrB family looped-hinge helix DNA binding protein
MAEKPGGKVDACFYGTATIGERGQIVIPADLRKLLDLHPGDKLLIWQHPSGKGILLLPADSVREFMEMMLATLRQAEAPEAEPQAGSQSPVEPEG